MRIYVRIYTQYYFMFRNDFAVLPHTFITHDYLINYSSNLPNHTWFNLPQVFASRRLK